MQYIYIVVLFLSLSVCFSVSLSACLSVHLPIFAELKSDARETAGNALRLIANDYNVR